MQTDVTVFFPCTAESPWRPGMRLPIKHPDAVWQSADADYVAYHDLWVVAWCPHCGLTWRHRATMH